MTYYLLQIVLGCCLSDRYDILFITDCAWGMFKCTDNKLCVHDYKFCDGIYDCADFSDEPVGCFAGNYTLSNWYNLEVFNVYSVTTISFGVVIIIVSNIWYEYGLIWW